MGQEQMRRKSVKKLSGGRLHRFFMLFFQDQADIKLETAERLAHDLSVTFTSVRLRRDNLTLNLRRHGVQNGNMRQVKQSMASPLYSAYTETTQEQSSIVHTVSAATKFDPYSFGLVPVFVREGPDGLMKRLNEVDRLDHLRKIARAQQIALPVDLRNGEAAVEDVRYAIVAAVRKRIADRRAAAG